MHFKDKKIPLHPIRVKMVGIRKFIVDFETTGSKKLLEKLLFNSTRVKFSSIYRFKVTTWPSWVRIEVSARSGVI